MGLLKGLFHSEKGDQVRKIFMRVRSYVKTVLNGPKVLPNFIHNDMDRFMLLVYFSSLDSPDFIRVRDGRRQQESQNGYYMLAAFHSFQ